MKFSLESDLDFEADSSDEALLKLAMHFMSLMEARPAFVFKDKETVDILGALTKSMPSLDIPSTQGYIDVDIHGDFAPPERIQ